MQVLPSLSVKFLHSAFIFIGAIEIVDGRTRSAKLYSYRSFVLSNFWSALNSVEGFINIKE